MICSDVFQELKSGTYQHFSYCKEELENSCTLSYWKC